ncbi:MAG: matrixin family metalloprotease [Gemmatimonadales bacterium]
MGERRLTGMIAAAAVLIALFILWDAFRPDPRPRPAPGPEDTLTVVVTQTPAAPSPAPPSSVATRSQGTAGGAPTPVGESPNYIELLARSETRRRLRASASTTYLNEMVKASGDSLLRRWDNRNGTPLRVWFAPTHAANFQPAFLDAIHRAFAEWTAAGVPVTFELGVDSSQANVTLRWRIQFEIDRTGQTDLTWDENGHVQSAVITLATFDAKGRPMDADDIRVVALHEIGHLLGLDHSGDSTDIMFPTAQVRQLSVRDVRSALLLYQLSAGSLR